MVSELTVLACFIAGLASSLHCVGMCGGIATMISLQFDSKNLKHNRLISACIYNIGRIFSYALIGLLIGVISQFTTNITSTFQVHTFLQFFASVILILIALHMLGVFSILNVLERYMVGIWRPIQSLLKNILPAKSAADLFILGLIWGWLPCGLVYSIALLAATTGNAIMSSLYMIAFGLGTLPGMVTVSYSSSFLNVIGKNKIFRYLSAGILILIALITLYLSLPVQNHQMHHHH